MEYLVTMTTHVPDGPPPEAADDGTPAQVQERIEAERG
jgi:hypothetical protein